MWKVGNRIRLKEKYRAVHVRDGEDIFVVTKVTPDKVFYIEGITYGYTNGWAGWAWDYWELAEPKYKRNLPDWW